MWPSRRSVPWSGWRLTTRFSQVRRRLPLNPRRVRRYLSTCWKYESPWKRRKTRRKARPRGPRDGDVVWHRPTPRTRTARAPRSGRSRRAAAGRTSSTAPPRNLPTRCAQGAREIAQACGCSPRSLDSRPSMSPAARRALVWSLGIVLGSRRAAGAGRLTAVDVQRIITQAVVEAQRVALPVTVAVVDREGNVLGVFRMDGAAAETVLRGRGRGGLDGTFLASRFAAISKAGTAAFFSTRGNAFSTRTAGFIIQSHFPPGVTNTASGPLFGVQFFQLPCGDVNPKLPPGLSADPGGVPLYKGGQAVGGVGVEGNGKYTADVQPSDEDVTREERIAVAATRGFPTPEEIRGDRIYVNGLRLPFRNVEPGGRRRLPP